MSTGLNDTNSEIYQPLIENLLEEVPLTEEEIQTVCASFTIKSLEKKEILLFKGAVSNHMRFVSSGCLRVYSIDEESNEHILQFGVKGWWVNDLHSYLAQKPAHFFLEAVKPTVVLQIHRDQLNTLFDTIPSIDRFFRIKFGNALVALQERNIEKSSLPAKERYQRFCKQYPNIEQLVPNYMIASYLGITPVFLSILRKGK